VSEINTRRRFFKGSTVLLGAAVALAPVHSVRSEGQSDDFPGGSFDTALNKIFAGEGGESGIGFSPLRQQADGKWSFSVPALDGAQVKQAVSGNSLYRDHSFAIHLSPSGQYEGWQRTWRQEGLDSCPTQGSANYSYILNSHGECWVVTDQDVQGGWTIEGDLLCFDPVPSALTNAQCNRVSLVLNSLVLWDPDGHMIGKGNELHKGKSIRRTYLD
jgi:hypothetical protein